MGAQDKSGRCFLSRRENDARHDGLLEFKKWLLSNAYNRV